MASIRHCRRQVNSELLTNPIIRKALSKAAIEGHCHRIGYRWRRLFWSPSVTLVTFLLQVLDGARTLRSAVVLLLFLHHRREQARLLQYLLLSIDPDHV